MSHFVEIEDLSVEFKTRNGIVPAVRNVSFDLTRGETLGIVGESGSGKSVTSYALMRILDQAGRIANGRIVYSGINIREASESAMRDLRGREISMIFQNPGSALNPIRKVGKQIEDVLLQHAQAVRSNARNKAIELLQTVRIASPEKRYDAYPYELSGGMCQRIVIALALACRPQLLIADEPTTGLDVTTQKVIMDLVVELTSARNMTTILITHDLGLASMYCDRVIVMQAGQIVESATTSELFSNPKDPYTKRLICATPRRDGSVRDLLPPEMERTSTTPELPQKAISGTPLLAVRDLVKEFQSGRDSAGWWKAWRRNSAPEADVFRAVDGISFDVPHGRSVGLVGESGCGKSTTSSMIMRLIDVTSGTIEFMGQDIAAIPVDRFNAHPLRSSLQMVFQDPTDSLNPRFTASHCIDDPIRRLGSPEAKRSRKHRVKELADLVGLPQSLLDRFPHQLSGGQKARVGIARAIALNPKFLILDEPTAALDVSVQAIVLNLLVDLKAHFDLSYLFVSHDLNVVQLLCDEVIVMKAGRIVERGDTQKVMTEPKSEYTRQLLDAVPQFNH